MSLQDTCQEFFDKAKEVTKQIGEIVNKKRN